MCLNDFCIYGGFRFLISRVNGLSSVLYPSFLEISLGLRNAYVRNYNIDFSDRIIKICLL